MKYRPDNSWSLVSFIIGLNVMVAIASAFFLLLTGLDPIQNAFALRSDAVVRGRWWEFFSYMWVHANPFGWGILHILFNMFTLWMFGRPVEQALGKLSFTGLYLLGGLAAAGAFFLEFWIRSGFSMTRLAEEPYAVIGASGAVVAVISAFSCLRPDARVFIMFLPFPVKVFHAVIGFIVISFLLMFYPPLAFIGHSAHIGGAVFGFIWMTMRKKSRRRPSAATYSRNPGSEDNISFMDETELRREVERVICKASAQGVHSLTPYEQTIIRKAKSAFFP